MEKTRDFDGIFGATQTDILNATHEVEISHKGHLDFGPAIGPQKLGEQPIV